MKIICLLLTGMLAMPISAKDIELPLTPATIVEIRGKSLVLARPAKVRIGAAIPFLIGDLSPVMDQLNPIESSLEDPADIITKQILLALEDQYEIKVLPTSVVASKKGKFKDILETDTDADLVLDARSVGWEFRHYRDFKTYLLISTQN